MAKVWQGGVRSRMNFIYVCCYCLSKRVNQGISLVLRLCLSSVSLNFDDSSFRRQENSSKKSFICCTLLLGVPADIRKSLLFPEHLQIMDETPKAYRLSA